MEQNGTDSSGGIDIASRIRQFSSEQKLDSNSNYTNAKPNPALKKRPQTQEVVGFNARDLKHKPTQDRKCVNRSSSSPVSHKKPLVPEKPLTPKSPNPGGTRKPVSPTPATRKPRSSSELISTINSSGITNNESDNSNSNIRKTSLEKPKLPCKPSHIISNSDSNISKKKLTAIPSDNNSTNIKSQKSWKQTAGPPRKPVPSGPHIKQSKTSVTSQPTSPLKPLRGIQKFEAYEDNDITPAKHIKNNPNSGINNESRRGTLDGQMILGPSDSSFPPASPVSYINQTNGSISKENIASHVPTKPPLKQRPHSLSSSTSGAEDESYDYTYEQQFLPPQKAANSNSNNNNNRNVYDQAEFSTVQNFMSTIPDEEDSLYNDPDEFQNGQQQQQNHHTSSSLRNASDDDDDLYEDPNSEDFRSPMDAKPPAPPPHKHAAKQDSFDDSEEDDDLYDFPPKSDEDDYEEPPLDARQPVHTTVQSSSDDDGENYDFPDVEPPPVPKHNLPPQVPSHKNAHNSPSPPIVPSHKTSVTTVPLDNNSEWSSSDDDDDRDYTDPESFLSKPPPIPNFKYSSRIGSMRRGSNLQPLEYMPVSEMVPVFQEDDEMLADSLYTDPATALSTKPPSLRQQTSSENEEDDIYSDEPLYQVYNQEVNDEKHRLSKKQDSKSSRSASDDDDNELSVDLVTIKKGSTMRMLWSELPSVRKSGYLDTISEMDRKRQEAMFEMITSEASYLKSLRILISHFMLCNDFLPNPNLPSPDGAEQTQILDRQQYHFLFSGISAIKGVSERFLKDLHRRQQSSVLMDTISDIILEYAENHLQCYVKYCSNQVFQDRTFQALLASNTAFGEKLLQLEKDSITQGLSLQSFLTLPMQRITRLPLLVDAICSRCSPGSEKFHETNAALKAVNIVVHDCNEGARKMERTEEMYFIQKNLTWKVKPIPLVSASRWLVKKGDMMCLHEEGRFSKYKMQLRQIFRGKFKPIYIFLFTDIVLVTKMKSDEHFKVIDVCQRSLLKVEVMTNIPDPEPPKVGSLATLNINPLKYAFTLVLLENINKKTMDYHCFLSTETDKTRWLEAFNPPKANQPSVEGESIYEEWDCPQVQVIHNYTAQQSDELTLLDGDVISVLRKLPDGWAEGMRMRDDEKGWFPINHTDEIDSRHMRARNLMQRYRLITTSKQIVNDILGK